MAWSAKTTPASEQQLVAILAGTAMRMAGVLLGGFVLHSALPEWFTESFWLWLGFFYLVTLALETLLVLQHTRSAAS